MTSESSIQLRSRRATTMSSSQLFSEGDLVFAKVRGFPYWPAQVDGTIQYSSNTYPVVFFGTQET